MKNQIQYNYINLCKMIATLCVFCLHASMCANYSYAYTSTTWFLKTPAWAAVWVFFLFSGYFTEKGFSEGKYLINMRFDLISIISFYVKKFLKIGFPTLVFCFYSLIIVDRSYLLQAPKYIITRILSFTFKNVPGSYNIGVTWFVSTLMWLYLVAPLFSFIISKTLAKVASNHKRTRIIVVLCIILIAIGMSLRLYLYHHGYNWSKSIYTPFYCNLDIFLCGMLAQHIPTNVMSGSNHISLILFVILIVLNTRMYYLADYGFPQFYYYYQIIFPSLYIIVGCIVLVCNVQRSQGIPFAEHFNKIAFMFYLSHTLILNALTDFLPSDTSAYTYMLLLCIGFIITSFFSILLTNTFSFVNKHIRKIDNIFKDISNSYNKKHTK